MNDGDTTLTPGPEDRSRQAPDDNTGRQPTMLPLSIAPISSKGFPTALPAPSAGGFVLLRHHQRGGLGLVGVARDVALEREVAFKQIRPELADNLESRRRFVHEAKITGQLEHPGIVPVHALGSDSEGRPYYAMKFVRGCTLREAIAQYHGARSSATLRDLLRRFVSICQAIAYAHSKGVIHRDLKPANIMLGDYGETLILDWGLAKRIAVDSPDQSMSAAEQESLDALFADGATTVGQVLGTPGYLAPEQAAGSVSVAPGADVYSLGAVLYKLLCGRTSYEGSAVPDEILGGKMQPPVPPSRHCPGVPKALEAVCLRAMATRPEDRYDAAELAREIERWLSDEPVNAWPEPPAARALRWARHHKPAVAGLAVLLVSLTVALAVNNVLVRREKARTESARLRAEEAGARATAQEIQARFEAGIARANEREAKLQVARSLVFQGEALALAGQWESAKTCYADGGKQLTALGEPRAPADIGIWSTFRAAPPQMLRFQVGTDAVTAICFYPNGTTILLATEGGTLENRDVRTGEVVVPRFAASSPDAPGTFRAKMNCVAVSADGRFAASGSDDGTLTLWDATTGNPLQTFHGHTARVTAIAFCGSQLLSGSADKTLKLWEAGKADPLWTFRGHAGGITALACSADGHTAFSGGSEPDDNLRSWDVPARRLKHVFSGHTDNVAAVSLSRDGLVAVSGSADGTVRRWDVNRGELIQTLDGHGQTISAVSLSHDKQRVLAGSLGGDLRLWSVEQGRPLATFLGHHAAVTSVAFSDDGRIAVSGAADGTLFLWDASAEQESGATRTFRAPDAFVSCVTFSRDGLTALSGGYDQTVRLWDVATGLPLAAFTGHAHTITSVTFSPDGRTAASAGEDGTIMLWDLQQKAPPRAMAGRGRAINAVAFSPDGKSLATGAADGAVWLWDVRSALPASLGQTGQQTRAVTSLTFSPDGRTLLCGSADGTLHLWRIVGSGVRSGPGATLGKQGSAIICLAVSPDGRAAISGARGGKLGKAANLMLWDLTGATPPRVLVAHREAVCAVGFTPDSRFALSCSLDEEVFLWDLKYGDQPFRGSSSSPDYFDCAAFSSDGHRLISGGYDKPLRVWDFDGPARCMQLLPRSESVVKASPISPGDRSSDPAALCDLGEWYAFWGHPDWAVDFFAPALPAVTAGHSLTWARSAWRVGDLDTATRLMEVAKGQGDAPQSYLLMCLHALESARNRAHAAR